MKTLPDYSTNHTELLQSPGNASTTIPVGKNTHALIDVDDLPLVSTSKWWLIARKTTRYALGYVEGKNVYMHRLIMSCPPGKTIDHINGDGLDNRKSNLRICTFSQNVRNRKHYRNSVGYLGVFCHPKRKTPYFAQVSHNHKAHIVGMFSSPLVAALARDLLAIKHHGIYASLNTSIYRRITENGDSAPAYQSGGYCSQCCEEPVNSLKPCKAARRSNQSAEISQAGSGLRLSE